MNKHVHWHAWSMSVIFFTGLLIISSFQSVAAQTDFDNDGILDSKESQLASTYAPYLHFAPGETFFPTNVSYHIDNSVLYLKSDDTNTLEDSSPTMTNISQYEGEDYFLNNTLGSFENIAEDYETKKEDLGYPVYTRVINSTEYYIIQYWFFYAYNPGHLNQHQGDWEMIEIVLDSSETPLYAVYSAHFSGEKASWSDVDKVDGTHPRVFVALGSHANYFRPYQGKLGLESDIVGNAFILEPSDLQIVLLGEKGSGNHPPSQDWLDYEGRWGDWARAVDAALGASGPHTPGSGENAEKWSDPITWASDVFLVSQTWFTLSWISYHFLYIFAGIIAALAAFKVWRIVRRKRQGKLNLKAILHSKGNIGLVLGIAGITLYVVALVLPWYSVQGNVQTTVLETVGETDLLLIDGVNGVTINTMQSDQGLAPLFGLAIPFSIILLSSVVLNILDIIGVEKPEKLSKTFIKSGITSFIPVILMLILISQLAGLIMPFADSMAGGTVIPPQIDEIARRISSSPINGEYSSVIEPYGYLAVSWGLAIGSYMFIIAAIIKLTAGILTRKAIVPEKPEKSKLQEQKKEKKKASIK